MQEKILAFTQHVSETSSSPDFLHYKWFVKWHLEIVARLALELCDYYPAADRDLVEVMAWLHDYGKTLNYVDQYATTLSAGHSKLSELGFPPKFVDTAIAYIEMLDKKLEIDLSQAPLEVQIVSSADGCSHMTGPFLSIFWNESTDPTFKGKTFEELMTLNLAKVEKDWKYKIVLPEARQSFESRYNHLREQAGILPAKYFE